jgi:hypothetical protein
MELQERIFQYLRTVDKATPRRIAGALGENRTRVKRTLEQMAKAGVLENLVERLWIPEEIFNDLFPATKPVRALRPSPTSVGPQQQQPHPFEIKSEVRRM